MLTYATRLETLVPNYRADDQLEPSGMSFGVYMCPHVEDVLLDESVGRAAVTLPSPTTHLAPQATRTLVCGNTLLPDAYVDLAMLTYADVC